MVKGLSIFREHFRKYEQEFVLIGGAACDEWFNDRHLRFRATNDLDIVLLVEGLTPSFLHHFWTFIKNGEYQTRQRLSGDHEYFRFLWPKQADYPAMIELFSRQPDQIRLFEGQDIVPINIGEDSSSLSAILVNDDYYHLILNTRESRDGLPMVRIEGLIPLKAHAWLDLTRRNKAGDVVDTADIKKHRNDVFRLALILPEGGRATLPDSIRTDLSEFIEAFPLDSKVWPDIIAALRNTIGRPPPPDIIRQTVIDTFSLQ